MATLQDTGFKAHVKAVLINDTPNDGLATRQVKKCAVGFEGMQGDWHATLTRKACVRTRRQYTIGTKIRNTRQVSIVSVEELVKIALKMGIDNIKPEWLGANLLISGTPDVTLLPPSSRLIFSSGASLVVDMENEPCKYPGEIIEAEHPGFGHLFANSARNLRGVTAWVEREGAISEGDAVALHMPPQRIWAMGSQGS
jgi:MOSC domain-containing protein